MLTKQFPDRSKLVQRVDQDDGVACDWDHDFACPDLLSTDFLRLVKTENPRFGMFKIIATCPDCGSPISINRPQTPTHLRVVPADSNKYTRDMDRYPERVLKDYQGLEPGEGKNSSLMDELTLQSPCVRLPPPDPVCPKCQTDWELAKVTDGEAGVITCQKCGRTSTTFPAPAWLKAGIPAARQIFFGERDADDMPSNVVDPKADVARPIALRVPNATAAF